MSGSKKAMIAVLAAVCLIIGAMIISFFLKKESEPDKYILAAYRNTVALFKNGEIVEVYDDVVLSSLPKIDRDMFSKGIEITDTDQVSSLLEDYDG